MDMAILLPLVTKDRVLEVECGDKRGLDR